MTCVKRRLIKLGLFLLLGAIVNVVVAEIGALGSIATPDVVTLFITGVATVAALLFGGLTLFKDQLAGMTFAALPGIGALLTASGRALASLAQGRIRWRPLT